MNKVRECVSLHSSLQRLRRVLQLNTVTNFNTPLPTSPDHRLPEHLSAVTYGTLSYYARLDLSTSARCCDGLH